MNPPYRPSNWGNPSQSIFRHGTQFFREFYSRNFPALRVFVEETTDESNGGPCFLDQTKPQQFSPLENPSSSLWPLLQNKFGLVFFRLFDGALETSNFRFEEARSAITLIRCFLHENTQRRKIARVKFAEELGTMSKNRLRWITLVRGPTWGIHSLTLMISCVSSFCVMILSALFLVGPRLRWIAQR